MQMYAALKLLSDTLQNSTAFAAILCKIRLKYFQIHFRTKTMERYKVCMKNIISWEIEESDGRESISDARESSAVALWRHSRPHRTDRHDCCSCTCTVVEVPRSLPSFCEELRLYGFTNRHITFRLNFLVKHWDYNEKNMRCSCIRSLKSAIFVPNAQIR